MTSLPPKDPLVALWQTAPEPDTHHLLYDFQRLNRQHQRLHRSILAILCGIAVLLIFEEATGGVATHGILSAIWILGLVIGLVWQRRARCNRTDALSLNTISLLKYMIARAKSDLFLARCLYAGVPLGAAAGLIVLNSPNVAANTRLQLFQTGAGVGALLIMIVTGLILARSRHAQVQVLTEKLKSISDEL